MKLQEKWISYIALVLSFIAIAFSLFVLVTYCPRTTELELDYMGIIIGILALLVTILIGWNIYTVLDFKNQIFKAQIDYDSMNNKLKEADQMVYNANITTNYALYQFYTDSKKPAGAITAIIIALSAMIEMDLAGNNKIGNIKMFSQYLSTAVDEYNKGKFQFGDNNIRILESNIKKIKENKDYHYVMALFDESFSKIETIISNEKKQYD